MRIAVVHSAYSTRQPSGENRVVEDQVLALREAGHEILLIERRTDDAETEVLYPWRSAIRVATGFGANPIKALTAFDPDVVHIHNLFPNFGSRWLEQWSGPTVMTLHNFRLVCSNGLLYRDGRECNECPQRGSLQAIKHSCYRNSRLATAPVALGRKRARQDVMTGVDALITTSSSFDQLLRANWPTPINTTLIPNFGAGLPEKPGSSQSRHGWLAMGRLSPEKGFRELLDIWPENQQLTVIGDGSEKQVLLSRSRSKPVEFRAPIPIQALRKEIPSYRGLIFPSRWAEAAPQIVVEAARVGLPIVTFRWNGISPLVSRYGCGTQFDDRKSLVTGLQEVDANLDAMSYAATEMFRDLWLEDKWLQRIESLYKSLIHDSREPMG